MTTENSSPTPSRSTIAPATASALGAALLFGATTPAASILARSVSPLWLSSALYFGVAMLLARPLVSGRRLALRADLPWLAASALIGGVAGPALLVFGLRRTDAASASLLLAAEPVATALIAWLVVREHASRRTVAGMAVIALGTGVLAWRGSPNASLGSIAVLGAASCWGIDNNLAARITSSDAVAVSGIKGLVAASVSLLLALIVRDPPPAAAGFAAGALLGLVGYGISLVFFMQALRGLGAARTGAYFATAPFAGALISLALGRYHDPGRLAVAGGLMALGVWLHLSERHEHEHAHEARDHEHEHVHDEHHAHQHGPGDPAGAPHAHAHYHAPLVHRHRHAPDTHHHHAH